jgi:hypothetical protein
VTYLCIENTWTLELDQEILDMVFDTHQEFEKRFQLYQMSMLKAHKFSPLNYIVGVPKGKEIPKCFDESGDVRG